jgi:hypothetical protein
MGSYSPYIGPVKSKTPYVVPFYQIVPTLVTPGFSGSYGCIFWIPRVIAWFSTLLSTSQYGKQLAILQEQLAISKWQLAETRFADAGSRLAGFLNLLRAYALDPSGWKCSI